MSDPTIICTLFRGESWVPHNRLYDEEWVNKLYRGFRRNLTRPFRFVCLTDWESDKFEPGVERVPYAHKFHSRNYIGRTEIFRPDLGIERGLFCGLDSVVLKPMDAFFDYDGPLAMPRHPQRRQRGFPPFCTGLTLFHGPSMAPLWENYIADPKGTEAKAQVHPRWKRLRGHPSEMLYWIRCAPTPIDPLAEVVDGHCANFNTCRKNGNLDKAHFIYFSGRAKPHKVADTPAIRDNWI